MFPHLFQHWLTAKSAQSFKVPIVCHPVFIMIVWVPCVLMGIWATTIELPPPITANPNAVLPFMVKTLTGDVLGGLLTAGILAAIMSSLDSQFLCLGTIFSNDIVGHYAGHDRFTDQQQVWLARIFIVLIVAVTYILSLLGYKSVFAMGVWCFSGFASLFPLVFAALYWKRLTAAGACAGVMATAASWFYFFREAEYGGNRTYTIDLMGYEVMPVLAIFLCSLVAMVVVSLLTRTPSEATLARFFPAK
jgi:SSS family solute:Na+ symporter